MYFLPIVQLFWDFFACLKAWQAIAKILGLLFCVATGVVVANKLLLQIAYRGESTFVTQTLHEANSYDTFVEVATKVYNVGLKQQLLATDRWAYANIRHASVCRTIDDNLGAVDSAWYIFVALKAHIGCGETKRTAYLTAMNNLSCNIYHHNSLRI